MTQKQVVVELIDIKYLSQIIVTDTYQKWIITNTYHKVLHYKYATNIVWDKQIYNLDEINTDPLQRWVVYIRSNIWTISKKRSK